MRPKPVQSLLLGAVMMTVAGVMPGQSTVAVGAEGTPVATGPKADPDVDGKGDDARVEKARRDYSDGAAVRSRLIVRAAGKGQPRAIVVLGRPAATREIPENAGPPQHSLLARELIRQALLIAARDELGLSTRDEVIGDSPSSEGEGKENPARRIEVVSFSRDRKLHERIYRIDGDQLEVVCSHDLPEAGPTALLDVPQLVEAAEALSRRGFPAALKELGLDGTPNALPQAPGSDLPKRAETRLSSLGFTQTVAAIRDLHRAIRSSGETPARMGALVRGYAQLGILSEFLWDPAHKVFKARSLLYAQRLVARDPRGPWGLWHRAFALALAGLHQCALDDLDRARKLAGPGARPPAWLEMIDAAARCDVRRLAAEKEPHKPLATFLLMTTMEFPTTTAISLNVSRAVVMLDPLCFRAHDAMCQYHGVNSLHSATELGPQVLQQHFANDLARLETLPTVVRDRLADQAGVMELAGALEKAGAADEEAGEPSWSVLAHLIRETRFVQVWRRLRFMKESWGVPVDEYWNEVRADVTNHRYRPYLDTFVLPPQAAWAAFQAFADRFDLTDVEITAQPMIQLLSRTQRPRGKAAWGMVWSHMDRTARERSLGLSNEAPRFRAAGAREILAASPYNHFARAELIEHDWDKVKDQEKAWLKESGDSPTLLGALARHHIAELQEQEAERVLLRYIQQSPDLWAYRMLAELYKGQGKVDRWQATLDDFVNKVEDLGLDHANIRIEIAEYFMTRKDWEKAQPYAEAAAESGSQMSMECAARCAEGMKDWERAEAWHRAISERYIEGSATDWFYFCKRTGHGNVKAARDHVDQVIRERAARRDPLLEEDAGCFYWLDGRTAQARATFEKAYSERGSIVAALCLAMLADDARDAGRRDQILKDLIARYKQPAPRACEMCQILLDTLFHPAGQKEIDVKKVERLIDVSEFGREFCLVVVGRFFKNHGQPDAARKLLDRSIDSPKLWIGFRTLAEDARKRLTPRPAR